MRHLHAFIVATGLCVPSLAFAAAPVDHGQLAHAPLDHGQLDHRQGAMASQPVLQAAPTQRGDTTAQSAAAQSDRARYAAKEATSTDAKDYRGGDTVVIGASAATAILAVILLIVLI
jgi:hypothetical protein